MSWSEAELNSGSDTSSILDKRYSKSWKQAKDEVLVGFEEQKQPFDYQQAPQEEEPQQPDNDIMFFDC